MATPINPQPANTRDQDLCDKIPIKHTVGGNQRASIAGISLSQSFSNTISKMIAMDPKTNTPPENTARIIKDKGHFLWIGSINHLVRKSGKYLWL